MRKDDPYGVYDRVDWKIIVQKEGDVFAKAVVRILEMYESLKIIEQCINKMPKGEIETEVRDIPPGEGIGRHEAPRGEVYHYVRSDGTNRPVRHKIRAPSYMNGASNKVAGVGGTVSDAAITLAAVDPCYCCTERTAVFRKDNNKKILSGDDLIKLSQARSEEVRKKLQVNAPKLWRE